MQLLAASKSLMGARSAPGRYRMAAGNLLPKFNAVEPTTSPASVAKIDLVNLPPKPRIENRETTQSARESKYAFIKRVVNRARLSFFETGSPFVNAPSEVGAAVTGKPGKIKPVKLAVQGELSLDKVKVVRNDLSDTDLEVVPVTKMAPPDLVGPSPASANQSASTETSWGRLTTRIFGARQTPV